MKGGPAGLQQFPAIQSLRMYYTRPSVSLTRATSLRNDVGSVACLAAIYVETKLFRSRRLQRREKAYKEGLLMIRRLASVVIALAFLYRRNCSPRPSAEALPVP